MAQIKKAQKIQNEQEIKSSDSDILITISLGLEILKNGRGQNIQPSNSTANEARQKNINHMEENKKRA